MHVEKKSLPIQVVFSDAWAVINATTFSEPLHNFSEKAPNGRQEIIYGPIFKLYFA